MECLIDKNVELDKTVRLCGGHNLYFNRDMSYFRYGYVVKADFCQLWGI